MHKDWSFKNHQDISADPPFDTEGGTQSKRLLKVSYSGNNECNNLLNNWVQWRSNNVTWNV